MEENKMPKQKKKKNLTVRLIVVVLILVLLGGAVLTLLRMKPAGSSTNEIVEEWKTPEYLRSKMMSILICGVDNDAYREGEDMAMMTDVIMMCNIDREKNSATLLQIPRDTYVGKDVVYYGKINGLYNWGRLDDESVQPGIGALASVINEQFKLPIDNYVMVTMEGFRTAVDMLGGVEIVLDSDMTFNIRDLDENITDTLELKAGVNVLDGATADLFVRYREYVQADIERMNMQRRFLAALMSKCFSTSTTDMIALVRAIYPYLETDFSIAELISLAMEAKDMSMEEVTMVRVPGEGIYQSVFVPGEMVDSYGELKQAVFSVHKKALADQLNEYMRPYDEKVTEAELGVIEIQNQYTALDEQGASLGEYSGEANEGE